MSSAAHSEEARGKRAASSAHASPSGKRARPTTVADEDDDAGNVGFFDVYGSDACAGVEFKKERKHPLKLADVSQLVLWVLGEGTNPNWVFIKNKPLISKVVLLYIPGIDRTMLTQYRHLLKELLECCGAPMAVHALSAMVSVRTTMESLLTVAPPRETPKEQRQREALSKSSLSTDEVPAGAASEAGAARRAELPPSAAEVEVEDAQPPFDKSYYVLTPADMIDHNYPMPVEDADGNLRCPEGFVATQPARATGGGGGGGGAHFPLLAVDCEMCYTAAGLELTRATFVSESGLVVYDELVLPPRPITDFNTRYSGITAAAMHGVTTSLADVQAWLLSHASSETLLVGHALENDLKALLVLHSRVIDTAVLFPHPRGPPFKPALRVLSERFLHRKIQQGGELGHDSCEDARAALDLALLKVRKGPAFGEPQSAGVSLFETLQSSARRSVLVDRRHNLHRFVTGSAGAIPCHSDAEAVRLACKEARNPRVDLLWVNLCELGVLHEARARRRRETEEAARTGAKAAHDPPKPVASLKETLQSLSSLVKQLHAALPANALLVVSTGQGDTAEVRRLQEQKFKRVQRVDGRPAWDDEGEARLAEATQRAKQAACFVAMKKL